MTERSRARDQTGGAHGYTTTVVEMDEFLSTKMVE